MKNKKTNTVGVFLRTLRAKHNEYQKDMAKRLNVSPQYLSKLELGSRTMTDAVETSLIREYNLRGEDVKALRKARAESNEEVKFNSNNSLPINKVEMLKELQSVIGTMSDEDVRAVLRVLNKHKPRGMA